MAFAIGLAMWSPAGHSGDWTQWCGGPERNAVSSERGLPNSFAEPGGKAEPPGKGTPGEKAPRLPPLRNVLWSAPLGVATYGTPVVADGKVFVGGCISYMGDHAGRTWAALWCVRETDGQPLWCFRSPFIAKLYNRSFGVTSTPTVEGDRLYVVGQMGDVLCLDVNGLANGNDGPFKEEESLLASGRAYLGGTVSPDGHFVRQISPGTPGKLEPSDADILWRYDMVKELNCTPYNSTTSSILILGDCLFVGTGSVGGHAPSVSKGSKAFSSPALIALEKKTGKLVAVDDTQMYPRVFHGAHSSPSYGVVNGRGLVFYGGGEGTCYAFDAHPEPGENDQPGKLKLVWKFNGVAPESYPTPAPAAKGARLSKAEIIATPVFCRNRVYVALGNDLISSGPRSGPGRLVCIDATQSGDISAKGRVWSLDTMRSSSSTVVIADGLLYTADAAGTVYCLDAETGKPYWTHPTPSVWGSPLVADGKVYIGTHGRGLLVLAAGKEKRVLTEATGMLALDASPVAANGVLYLATHRHLLALKNTAPALAAPAPGSTRKP